MVASFYQDLRLALRSLARRPGFTLGVVLVLAVGIGAGAAMLTVVHRVLVDPLPYPEPDRLVWGWGTWERADRVSVSPPDYLDYRESSGSFTSLAAMSSFVPRFNLTGEGPPERVGGAFVSANFLDTLGLVPALGRDFQPEEERHGAEPVAMISHRLWQRRFGGDPSVVGRTLPIDGLGRTVVGVLPAGLDLPADADVWQPIPFGGPETTVRRFHFLRVIGRLAPGVELEAAQAEVHTIAGRLAEAYPDSNETWTMTLVPLHEQLTGAARVPLLVLLGAVALVLLIACANVATLMMVRAFSRRGELTVRAALGATRTHLLGGLVAESLVLAAAGGALGLGVAAVLLRLTGRLAPEALPRVSALQPDGAVVLATLALSGLSALLFGLAPAWRATRRALAGVAGPVGGGGVAGARGLRARGRSALVVAQVALSMILLVGALLLLRSYAALQAVDPGFEPEGRVVAEVPLPRHGYDEDARRVALFSRLLERAAALPGIEKVAGIDRLPLVDPPTDTRMWREDRPPESGGPAEAPTLYPQVRHATPGYFAVLGIPRLQGRDFRTTDGPSAPPVVVLDATAVRDLFDEGESPLGRRIVLDFGEPWTAEVVGVVGSTRSFGLARPASPTVYLPQWQQPTGVLRLAILPAPGGPDTASLAPSVRRLLTELDPALPLAGLGRYEDLVATTLAPDRLRTGVLTVFAVTALVLAALGLYSVLSFLVGQRTRELGVRMALGAQRSDVLRQVLGRGLALAATGLVLGLLGALALGQVLRSLLFGVTFVDPVALVVGPVILALASLLASLLPARRATRVEPVIALREE